MSVQLTFYNTLTHAKAAFAPIDPARVRMYVCGPTVYDYAHIGNGRAAIVFDLLFRLLREIYGERHVIYARNVTDVDDKINARAARDYPQLPLNEAIAEVTRLTLAQYQEDVKALGCLQPTHEPRATDHVAEMRALIERLVQRGVAYVAEDHVLFSPAAMNALPGAPRYGALGPAFARRDARRRPRRCRALQARLHGFRAVEAVEARRAGMGIAGRDRRAGAAGLAYRMLGDGDEGAGLRRRLACEDADKNVFDIHGGGIDLVFPHHENEIAQSCCAFGTSRMANVWMHNGFLQVEG